MRPERDALEIRFPRVEGYRVELPEERLDRRLQRRLGPGAHPRPGRAVDHPERRHHRRGGGPEPRAPAATCGRPRSLFHLTKRLLYTKWRDPGEEPKLHLFGQLKRITKQWLDTCLVCKGGTYPAQLMYQELADMACNRITAGITRQFVGERPDQGAARSLQPDRLHQRTSASTPRKTDRWETELRSQCHINWVDPRQRLGGGVLPRGGVASAGSGLREEPQPGASRCRTATARRAASTGRTSSSWSTTATAPTTCCTWSSRSRATGARTRRRRSPTMDTYWVPGVNHLGTYGRWAFAEFTRRLRDRVRLRGQGREPSSTR